MCRRPDAGARFMSSCQPSAVSYQLFCCAARIRLLSFTIAATRPGIVYSLASMSTGNPNSRNVAEVTGPMDAVYTPRWRAGFFNAARALRNPSNSTKFLTVEELVKVIAWGLNVFLANRARSRVSDDFGTTVSYASTTSTSAPALRNSRGITDRKRGRVEQ